MIAQYTWSPKFSLPVASANFNFKEFVNEGSPDQEFETDAEGVVILIYKDTLESQTGSDLFFLFDQSLNQSINLPLNLVNDLPINGSITHSQSFDLPFISEPGSTMDSVVLSTGNLFSNLNWDFSQPGNLSITFQSILQNGSPLILSKSFTGALNDRIFQIDEDLSGSTLMLNNGTNGNRFQFDFEITLNDNGTPVSTADQLNMNFSFRNLNFTGMYGDLASKTIASDIDTISITFFENIIEGSLFVEEPTIGFTFDNSFGFPIDVDLNTFEAISSQGSLSLSGPITQSQPLGAPDFSGIGTSVQTEIEVNKDNSNFRDLIALLPNSLVYQFDGILDPNNLGSNFVLNNSLVDVFVEIQVPLFGSVQQLVAFNIFDFDGNDFNDVDFALVRTDINNGFPFEAAVQVYFLDVSDNRLDSLITNGDILVQSAIVDANGIVIQSTEKITTASFDRQRLDNIQNAVRVEIRASATTFNNGTQSIKILETYLMDVVISLQTQFGIKIG